MRTHRPGGFPSQGRGEKGHRMRRRRRVSGPFSISGRFAILALLWALPVTGAAGEADPSGLQEVLREMEVLRSHYATLQGSARALAAERDGLQQRVLALQEDLQKAREENRGMK